MRWWLFTSSCCSCCRLRAALMSSPRRWDQEPLNGFWCRSCCSLDCLGCAAACAGCDALPRHAVCVRSACWGGVALQLQHVSRHSGCRRAVPLTGGCLHLDCTLVEQHALTPGKSAQFMLHSHAAGCQRRPAISASAIVGSYGTTITLKAAVQQDEFASDSTLPHPSHHGNVNPREHAILR